MIFILKIIVAIIITVIILGLSSLIFNALDVEKYMYYPYVSWIILLIIFFLFLPSEHKSIFLSN